MSISHSQALSPTDFREPSAGAAKIRPAIKVLLAQLKRRIRGYVLLEGTALLAAILGALFWLTVVVDWSYFRLTALELPLWFRNAVIVFAVGLLTAAGMFWIVLRFFAPLRARALALVLERRFPQLGTRLITAVEMAEARTGRESQMTAAMIERTIDEAVRLSAALPLESVFNRLPLRRSLIAAAVLLVPVGAVALADPGLLSHWGRAFIARDAVYWPRETQLVVRAIVPPGDRLREFHDGLVKHPRGSDLVLLVEAAKGTKVPASVELRYVLDGGRGSGEIEMVKGADGQFRHTLSGLLDSLSLWVRGGDYVTRTPLRVDVVEPPRLDRVALDCDYPDYTGLDRDAQGNVVPHTVEVQGSHVALPMDTSFVFRARANKPLVAVRIESETQRLSLSRGGASLARKSASGDLEAETPLVSSEPFLSADGLDAAFRCLLSNRNGSKKNAAPSARNQTAGNGVPPGSKGQPAVGAVAASPPKPDARFIIPADCRMRIELEDTDGISSTEPIRLVINGIVDQPPTVQTELRGIGSSITRKAVIPVAGTVTDDYGVAGAQFEYRIGGEKDWRVHPLRRPPVGNPKEFTLRGDESETAERFEVLPLDLKIGQRLTLSVSARDGDNLNGPHLARGEEYTFQIVSDEELLSLLYVKEVNLRERFEKIISELEKVQKDLVDHRGRAAETAGSKEPNGDGKSTGDSESFGDLRTAVAVCAVRSLHQVRKNAVETVSVEESFRGLLQELVNNAVHTQQMVERIGDRIIGPLHAANEKDFPATDQAIGLFKLAVDGGQNAVPSIDRSIQSVSTVILHLKTALNEMQDLVKFHEAISRLQAMIKEQEQIDDSTRQEQKRKRLKQLKGLQ